MSLMTEVLNVVGDAIGVDFSGISEVMGDPHQDTLDAALDAITAACDQRRWEIHQQDPSTVDVKDLAQRARVAIMLVNRLNRQLTQAGVTVEIDEHELVQIGAGTYPNLSLRTFKVENL